MRNDYMCLDSTIPRERLADILETRVAMGVKRAFDPAGLLNLGKVIPTLARCAEYGKQVVRGGRLAHPDLLRF